jgi:hypothetical protein
LSLFKQIRDEVVDSNKSLADVLRKAKILATSLKQVDFRNWVSYELDCYPGHAELPEYRRISLPVLGKFSGPFGKLVSNYPLPLSMFPKEMRKGQDVPLTFSVRELETMSATMKKELIHIWPAEAALLLRDHITLSGGLVLIEVYQLIMKSNLEGVLDAVRNRLLDFLLKLQDIDPSILASDDAVGTIPHEKIAQAFNITVYGNHNVLAAGEKVTQTVALQVLPGDKDSLARALTSLGISDDDIRALQRAIGEDGAQSKGTLGKRVRNWTGRMLAKAIDGSWNIALAAAPELLKQAIFSHYGWN